MTEKLSNLHTVYTTHCIHQTLSIFSTVYTRHSLIHYIYTHCLYSSFVLKETPPHRRHDGRRGPLVACAGRVGGAMLTAAGDAADRSDMGAGGGDADAAVGRGRGWRLGCTLQPPSLPAPHRPSDCGHLWKQAR